MKKFTTLTAAALMSVALGSTAFAEDNVLRYAVDKTVFEIRMPEGEDGRILMTLEEFRLYNPKFANADDETVIPKLTSVKFTGN